MADEIPFGFDRIELFGRPLASGRNSCGDRDNIFRRIGFPAKDQVIAIGSARPWHTMRVNLSNRFEEMVMFETFGDHLLLPNVRDEPRSPGARTEWRAQGTRPKKDGW